MIYSSNKFIIKEKKKHFLFLEKEKINLFFMVEKEVRLGSPLYFFHFLILYSAIPMNLFFSLANLNLTFLVVLSHARDTKFVVEIFF
jgi:hypothetical protein